jgi:two-component system sensor histidine kinase YesM
MLQVLGRFLRYNISLRQESSLEEELNHIERYLTIYRYRVRNLIDYSVDRPANVELGGVRCPFCMLQPIVENCIKHGLRDDRPMIINVTIEQDGGDIAINIRDNGSGMDPLDIENMNALLNTSVFQDAPGPVGLQNVNARVSYFYGKGYGLKVLPNDDGGLTVSVRICGGHSEDMP